MTLKVTQDHQNRFYSIGGISLPSIGPW